MFLHLNDNLFSAGFCCAVLRCVCFTLGDLYVSVYVEMQIISDICGASPAGDIEADVLLQQSSLKCQILYAEQQREHCSQGLLQRAGSGFIPKFRTEGNFCGIR